MDEDFEAQSDEMMVMESILDPHAFHIVQTRTSDKPTSGILKIDFRFHPGFTVNALIRNEDKSFQKISKTVTHMPPLNLHFILSSDYPSKTKPIFTLSSTWLDRSSLSKLCAGLDKVWEEGKGSAVLYSWYTFLMDGLTFLGIATEYDITWCYAPAHFRHKKLKAVQGALDPRAVFDRCPEPMLDYLMTFNEEEAERVFRLGFHNCAICMSDKSGTACQRFRRCGHVFCTACITEYFQALITEGNLDAVRCPGFKCDALPEPAKVEEIVGKELFERYDRLLLKRTLENMADVITCPLPMCQCPVLTDTGDKLAKCPQCFYVFCSCCKSVYHGVEPCRFKSDDRKMVYEQYTSGDTEERKRLEKAFGKKQLDLLVQTVLSENWVSSRSKACPHCSVPIEKFEGCNKVTCFKCNTYFCWICSAQLDHGNPYLHFNDPTSKCYDNLFLDVDQDDNGGDENGGDEDSEDDDEEWAELYLEEVEEHDYPLV